MKRILIFVFSVALPVLSASAFSDVPSSHKYYEEISALAADGILEGYPDGTFKPGETINRVELTKIMVASILDYDPGQDPSGFDIYALAGVPFSDVESGEWYIPYLRKAVENDIISGYPDSTFRPEDEVNYAEAAKIIVESIGIKKESGGEWYEPYTSALQELNAVPESVVRFDQELTRGEIAFILYALRDFYTEGGDGFTAYRISDVSTLDDFKGLNPSVIFIGGLYCSHCQAEAPEFERLVWDEYKDEVNIWLQVIDWDDVGFPVEVAQGYNENISYEALTGESCGFVPAWVVLDLAGNVQMTSCGGEHTLEEMVAELELLLAS